MRIFNQIRKVLLKQNKFKDYLKYAFGEIILVVIGILIALQINNYNSDRKTDKERLLTLEILNQSFEKNSEEIINTLSEFDVNLKITNLRLSHTGPDISSVGKTIIDSIRIIDIINLELSNNLNSNILFDNKNISLLNRDLRNLLLEYKLIFSRYKNSENNATTLLLKLRENHQKYISLKNEIPYLKDSENGFKSDYIGWLRDRENQNISVEIKWKMELAILDLNKLKNVNDSILNLLNEKLN